MRVHLAGFNVDTTVLKELQEKGGLRDDVTPEVISAAYARISRDPRAIDEIRAQARREVEKTRRSNTTIIFKMGHHSVAEHAMFNLDIVGVSRYAMEEVEKFRLCSYTEKSQRYITLDKDYVLPEEIKGSECEAAFTDTIALQNKAYFELFGQLKNYVFEKHAALAKNPKNHNLLEGWAKEDARYITSLATESQVGVTVNARNLELMLRRFASHPLREIQTLGRKIYEEIAEIAPSIVIFHQANDRDQKTYPDLETQSRSLMDSPGAASTEKEIELCEYTAEGDDVIAAALLHTVSSMPYTRCREAVRKFSPDQKKKLFESVWRHMQFYDSMLREFEHVNLTFNIVLSAACFGQLKRHRMATITAQSYDPTLGITIPESVTAIGRQAYFKEIVAETEKAYTRIHRQVPLAAPYILTNAHRRRVLMRLNARELYHISRLRQDTHAQWDIRNVSEAMTAEAKNVMPLTFGLVGPKDKYNNIYQDIFGVLPKIKEALLPGKKNIT